jgi:hypothetical protein
MADAWQTLLHSVLPHLTTRRVGRLTDKSHRVVQKWYSGDMTIPDTVMHGVQDQAHLLEKTAFAADLKMIVDKAQKAGIHPEIIGALPIMRSSNTLLTLLNAGGCADLKSML